MAGRSRRKAWARAARGLASAALLCSARLGAAEDDALRVTAGDVALELGGFLQVQLDTTSEDVEDPLRIRIRRARPKAQIELGDHVTGVIEPELSASQVFLNDAYMSVQLDPALSIQIGRMGRPFEIVDALSARELVPIERGTRIRGVEALDHYVLLEEVAYVGRATGVALTGEVTGSGAEVTYTVGYYSGGLGEEEPRGGEDIEQVSARLTLSPMRRLTFGASATNREFYCQACARPEQRRGSAFGVDALYGEPGEPGPLVLVVVSGGVLDRYPEARFASGQVWLSYRFSGVPGLLDAAQPFLRASHGRPGGERAQLGGTLITPGVNLYIRGQTGLMLDYDVWIPSGPGPLAHSFKAQAQLAF